VSAPIHWNDHRIEHQHTHKFKGGMVQWSIVEPYVMAHFMHARQESVTLHADGNNLPVFSGGFRFDSLQAAEDYLTACLEALGQLATKDGAG
jgi:hypothetical protein